MHTANPTADDLRTYLENAGLDIPDTVTDDDLQDSADAGRQAFERACNRVILAGTQETRLLDPPVQGGILLLGRNELASLVSIAYQPSGSSATSWVAGTDYVALPQNAASQGVPITSLSLVRQWWPSYWSPLTYAGSIQVTGRFGYATSIPALAWRGMLAMAALDLVPQLEQSSDRGGVIEWQSGQEREKYAATGPLGVFSDRCQSVVTQAVKAYRRLTL